MKIFVIFLLFFCFQVGALSLYRVDQDPFSEVNNTGNKKSFIHSEGYLRPANIHGDITILDHVARSRIIEIKNNSQFTSFSSRDDLMNYYGDGQAYVIILDLDKLSRDIDSHKVKGVKIHSTSMIIDKLEDKMINFLKLKEKSAAIQDKFKMGVWDHLNAYFKLVRVEKVPQLKCDAFFWKGVNAFPKKFPEIFNSLSPDEYKEFTYIINGLRHVNTDEEWLIEGVIAKEYFVANKLDDKNSRATIKSLIDLNQTIEAVPCSR